ncbi:MAG: hypothetical protein ACTSX6_08640 [Candidatus Heimdallarchaeaceae archaeon]
MKKSIWEKRRKRSFPRIRKVWNIVKILTMFIMWFAFICLAVAAIESRELLLVIGAPVWLAITLFVFPAFKKEPEEFYE